MTGKTAPTELPPRAINVEVPGDLHRQMRVAAAEAGLTVKDWVLDAFRRALES
jgi:hypothetical protein